MNKNKTIIRLLNPGNRGSLSLVLAIMLTTILITGSSISSYSKMKVEPEDYTPYTGEYKGRGFESPEIDLFHLKAQEIPERFITSTLPSSFDWRILGKVTTVKDQQTCNSCWAFASLACFESKILIDDSVTFDLSEDNLKECEYYHSCCNPSNFWRVANYLSQDGTVLEFDDPYQPFHNNNPPCGTKPYQQTLFDWRVISGNNIPNTDVLKNYIYNEGPIYAALWSGANPYNAAWQYEFSNYDGTYTLYNPHTGETDHAVLVVGWDDSLTHAGGTGGWICKNSWGTNWGGTCGYGTEGGYFTIAYGSAAIGKYSSFIYQWGYYDKNGGIVYYDEGGCNYNWGYSSNTAWGLCEYGFMVDTMVSRVEFWTTDITTDVDVYIYDDFNGNDVSNMLWSSLDHAFDEAGYHGLAVVPSLTVMGMNSIYVVVKFTNKNYQYPVPSDRDGPTLTTRTYTSPDGSSGSWFDRGIGSPKSDVAIRLRISGDNSPIAPTINGPTSGDTNTLYTYKFSSIDPEGDKVSYYINWGDETETDWTPFQISGTTYSESHAWGVTGTYTIVAKAKDVYGVESGWSEFEVEIEKPRKRTSYNPLFLWFFYRFPLLERLLNLLR